MMSIEKQIESKISKAKEGSVFFPKDFTGIGSSGAIRVALHRLERRRVLIRLAKGIYVKPQLSKLLNKEIIPSIDVIVQAIAKRDRARLLPAGDFALYALGLSTQIPLNIIYYTDGKARRLNIGKNTVIFKKVSTKKLALKGEISKLVILALQEIGKGRISHDDELKIRNLLKQEKLSNIKHDIGLVPYWIGEFLAKSIEK